MRSVVPQLFIYLFIYWNRNLNESIFFLSRCNPETDDFKRASPVGPKHFQLARKAAEYLLFLSACSAWVYFKKQLTQYIPPPQWAYGPIDGLHKWIFVVAIADGCGHSLKEHAEPGAR